MRQIKYLVKNLTPERKITLSVAVALGMAWSWIFFIDATKVTSSSLIANIVAFISFCATVGLSAGIFYLAVRYLVREYKKYKRASFVFVAKVFVVWALAEWLIAFAVGLLWAGRNSSLDTFVPFGSLTPLLMYTPIGFAARFVGYYGLSALVVTTVTALLLKKYRRYGLILAAGFVLLATGAWALYRTPNGTAVDTLIVAEKLGQPQQITTDAELVVLPEYGLDNVESDHVSNRLTSTRAGGTAFVGSKQYPTSKGVQNVLIFGTTSDGFTHEQAKRRLVPAGEYLPYSVEFALRATAQTGILAEFEFSRAVIRGDKAIEVFRVRDGLVVGAEACSSIISTEDYRQLTRQGATVLTNSASLEVFGGSKIFAAQHKGMAKFMAVANARPLLQSSMDGLAFAMDHNGTINQRLMPVGTAAASVTTNQQKTPYTILGDWPVVLGLIYIVYMAVVWAKNKYKAKRT